MVEVGVERVDEGVALAVGAAHGDDTEGDMNPGKFIIRKEFLKAHRAQRALRNSISRGHSIGRCVDEVCAATGAIPGDDGDDGEAAAFCGGPSDARSDDVEARSDDVDAASIEASAA